MSTPETRGYLVGTDKNNRFAVPKKLMEKIVNSVGETALMIWLPYKKILKIEPVSSDNVIKLTIWFENITQTIFETELNPVIYSYKDILLYETGVLFPSHVSEKPSLEYYFRDGTINHGRIEVLEKQVMEIQGVYSVEMRTLERFTGVSE